MKSVIHLGSLAVVVTAFLGTACAHKPPVAETAPAPAPAPAAAPAPAPPAAPPPVACSSDDQCASNQLCLSGACTAITPSLAACGITRVHFDFDADAVHTDELPLLQRAARCIEANNPAHVLIAGNADERGTVEYNLALGQRRAAAVRKYLAQLGVSSTHLDTVSYGKEMPICTEHDEACWSKNRRSAVRPGEAATDIEPKVKADEQKEAAKPVKPAKGAKPPAAPAQAK